MRLFVFFISLAIVAAIIFTGGLTRVLVILGLLFVLLIAQKVREIIDDNKSESTKISQYSSKNTSKYKSKQTITSTNTTSYAVSLDKTIVYEVAEKLIQNKLVSFKKEDLDEEWKSKKNYDTEHINYLKEHGYDRCLTSESIRVYLGGPAWEIIHCFPCNSGGYCVLYLLYDGFDTEKVNFYFYKDDKIENYDKCPEPSLSDYFANADKLPSEVFNYFSQIITEKNYIYNFIGNKLEVSLHIPLEFHYGGEYNLPAPFKKYFEAKRYRDSEWGEYEHPMVRYVWNGEEFVRDPEYKPEEDLSLFE